MLLLTRFICFFSLFIFISLLFLLLALSLLFPYVFNGRFSRRSRRLRRQKTVSANESAKADAADNRRERQLPHSGMLFMLFAVCLRNNAACCIPLRDLRHLRENIHIRVLNLSAQTKPQCLSQITQIIADKTQNNNNQTVFLCDIMQPAAFLCVICAICGRIHARVLKQSAQMKPMCLPQISLIIADEPQNNINQTIFLCDIMQPAAFLCVICVICGRIHARVLKLSAQRNPNVSR